MGKSLREFFTESGDRFNWERSDRKKRLQSRFEKPIGIEPTRPSPNYSISKASKEQAQRVNSEVGTRIKTVQSMSLTRRKRNNAAPVTLAPVPPPKSKE